MSDDESIRYMLFIMCTVITFHYLHYVTRSLVSDFGLSPFLIPSISVFLIFFDCLMPSF